MTNKFQPPFHHGQALGLNGQPDGTLQFVYDASGEMMASVYGKKIAEFIVNSCNSADQQAARIAELEAALERIARATAEWDANKLGAVHLHRKRWQRCGEIAREVLAKEGNHASNI